jgi:PAS domain S-box-containing protein
MNLIPIRSGHTDTTEHAADARQDWLATIIDNAMDAIITVDETQQIVLFNKAAEKVFGIPALEAIGESLDRFIPVRLREAHRRHVQGFARDGVTSRSMHAAAKLNGLRTNGEQFPLEATISRAAIGEMKLYTVILRDLTPAK